MSIAVNGNNYNQYQSQVPKKNTAKKAALAIGTLAAVGGVVYLAKSGRGAEIAGKIKKNLEAFALGKTILSFIENTGKKINNIKTGIKDKIKDLHLGEKVKDTKQKVADSSLYKRAGEIKTNAQEKIKDLHLGEKVKDAKQKVADSSLYKRAGEIKTNAQKKIKDLHLGKKVKKASDDIKKVVTDADIKGKAKKLFDGVKGLFSKKS